jgi:hypothetical protein
MYYSVSGMPRVGFVEDISNYYILEPPCEMARSQLHLLNVELVCQYGIFSWDIVYVF